MRSTVAGAIALGALWFVLCRHLSGEWSINEQYSYGWFVPFFAAFLFWLRWGDRPQVDRGGQRSEDRGRTHTQGGMEPAGAERHRRQSREGSGERAGASESKRAIAIGIAIAA